MANDLLFLVESSCNQAKIIHEVLNLLCTSLCEKVNNLKCQVFFPKNIKPSKVKKNNDHLGLSITIDLGKYLGMPMIHKRVTINTYQGILENIEQ